MVLILGSCFDPTILLFLLLPFLSKTPVFETHCRRKFFANTICLPFFYIGDPCLLVHPFPGISCHYADPCLLALPFVLKWLFTFLDASVFGPPIFCGLFLSFFEGVALQLASFYPRPPSDQLSHLFAEFSEFSPIYFFPLISMSECKYLVNKLNQGFLKCVNFALVLVDWG